MRFVIVTGMSGAGKRTAMKMLEDAEYFCVDNLPISMIEKFTEMIYEGPEEMERVALGVDIRSGNYIGELEQILENLKSKGYRYEMLFLEAEDQVLIKRYKETRRMHPVSGKDRVQTGIDREREKLAFLKKQADYIIDTSNLLTRELKVELDKIFVENMGFKSLVVTVLSFGFKYGIPSDADLVFDVRFLPNPYYFEDMRPLTGNDAKVHDYVMDCDAAEEFLKKLTDMIEFLIPNYVAEGKTQLVIGIGCTGGKHRSVTLANELYQELVQNQDYAVKIEHRDIPKDAIRAGIPQ
ncbi:MAG: RNase adapter RapZ [Lachnospiraceae bacterium]